MVHELLIQGYIRKVVSLIISSEIILLITMYCRLYQQILFNSQYSHRQIYIIINDKKIDCRMCSMIFHSDRQYIVFCVSEPETSEYMIYFSTIASSIDHDSKLIMVQIL